MLRYMAKEWRWMWVAFVASAPYIHLLPQVPDREIFSSELFRCVSFSPPDFFLLHYRVTSRNEEFVYYPKGRLCGI